MVNELNMHHGSRERTFRCADVGFTDCNWQVTGLNDNDIMERVREHGRQAHGITNFDDNLVHKVQVNIRDRNAA